MIIIAIPISECTIQTQQQEVVNVEEDNTKHNFIVAICLAVSMIITSYLLYTSLIVSDHLSCNAGTNTAFLAIAGIK